MERLSRKVGIVGEKGIQIGAIKCINIKLMDRGYQKIDTSEGYKIKGSIKKELIDIKGFLFDIY